MQVEIRTEKVRRPKTDFLPLFHATNQHVLVISEGDRWFPVAKLRMWNMVPASLLSVDSYTLLRHVLNIDLTD